MALQCPEERCQFHFADSDYFQCWRWHRRRWACERKRPTTAGLHQHSGTSSVEDLRQRIISTTGEWVTTEMSCLENVMLIPDHGCITQATELELKGGTATCIHDWNYCVYLTFRIGKFVIEWRISLVKEKTFHLMSIPGMNHTYIQINKRWTSTEHH